MQHITSEPRRSMSHYTFFQRVNINVSKMRRTIYLICFLLACSMLIPVANADKKIIAERKIVAERYGTQPRRVIMDHDGNFEDYFAIFTAALASKQASPKIRLTAVLAGPTGEGYCQNSNGHPNKHEDTIVDMTEKALALAEYEADVVSGCDEQVRQVLVKDQDPTSQTFNQYITFRAQETLGGLGQCQHHREFGFQPWALQCYYEFSSLWRQDTLKLPGIADTILQSDINTGQWQQEPAISTPASDYLARAMCTATKDDPLTVLEVGPATTVGRALQKINRSPETYGCEHREQITDTVEVRFMGGAWDTNPQDNFDPVTQQYRIDDRESPDYTAGNIYYDPSTTLYAFGSPHVPDSIFDPSGGTDENSGFFNALNNAEWNFFVDSVAVDIVLRSGVPVTIGATNATDHAPLKGFGDRIAAEIAAGSCSTMPAHFVRDSIRVLPAADDLQWWDTLITTSLFENFVDYQNVHNVNITTPFNGEAITGGPFVWARDSGKLYAEEGTGRTVHIGLGVITNNGTSFKDKFDNYMLSLLCEH